jgi:sugar lactone lactonase YvrE
MMKQAVIIVIIAFCAGSALAEDAGVLFRKAVADYAARKYAEAADQFRNLHQSNPKDDISLYMLAASLAQSGNAKDSLIHLKALVDSGSCLTPKEKTFQSLASSPEYQSLARALSSMQSAKSETAATIPEPDFFPEGIAFDAANNTLFVGSIRKRKIARISIASKKVEPFVESKQDGLMAALGMKVDSKKQHLWAISVADPSMIDYSEKDAGMNAVYQFDAKKGTLIHKYELSGKPEHYLNDIELDATGRVYATDSATGQIFSIAPDGDKLEEWIPAGTFASPNGLAMSGNGKTLYVADTLKGIHAVTLSNRAIERLPVKAGIETLGIDGLYFYKNSLIGVFNMMLPGRIMQFELDETGRSITRSTVLECGHPLYDEPTTGAIAGDALYIIANSQLSRYNPDGTPFPIEQLKPITIMKLRRAR